MNLNLFHCTLMDNEELKKLNIFEKRLVAGLARFVEASIDVIQR